MYGNLSVSPPEVGQVTKKKNIKSVRKFQWKKIDKSLFQQIMEEECKKDSRTVRLLVPGHFYFYAVSKFSLRENDISVLLL